MRRPLARPLPVALLALLTAGVGCSDPSALPPPNPDVRPQTDTGAPMLPTPILDRGLIPSQTCEVEVGISGTATPGATILITGGASASGNIGDANAATGRFCVPVKLRLKQINNLQVVAQQENLGLSKPTMISIIQEDCHNPGEFKDAGVDGGTPSRNVALGMLGKSKEPPEKGNFGFLTDGNTTNFVLWKGSANWYCGWCDYGGWVMLTLEELAEVEKIVVKWRDSEGNGIEFGKEYKVLYTAVTEPPDPNLDDGYWLVAAEITEGDGAVDTFDLKSIGNPLIKHVALWLQQDGLSYWKETATFDTVDEAFAVTEIEVWNRPKTSGPPPPPPSVCAGF